MIQSRLLTARVLLFLSCLPFLLLDPLQSFAWQMKQASLMTYWAQQVSPTNSRPEYPRPQMVRSNWLNLNGVWQFQPGATNDTVPNGALSGDIMVPFPMESAISGVMQHYDFSWYQRTFTVPTGWAGQHILLHLDAVDWQSQVYVNGQSVGIHNGGYDPFSYDITSYLNGSGPQTLTIRVYDPVDKVLGGFPTGKQSVLYGAYDYTASSGIWQTVWLEPVPATSISDIRLIPDIDNSQLKLTVTVSGSTNGITVNAVALAGTNNVGSSTGVPGTQFTIPVPNPTLWCPTNPYLYNLNISLQSKGTNVDSLASYFGMRKVSIGNVGGHLKLLLNNQFTFLLGTLDQGYWPDGVYTAPTDAALRSDIEQHKLMGFNMIRKHMKVECLRWYYWADKLGEVVWQDMPATYWSSNPAPVNPEFEMELTNMIKTHWNSPSIIDWTVYNEGWGQPDAGNVGRVCTNVMNLDPSRPVDEGSGGNDYDVANFNDVHHYPDPQCPTSANQALCNNEYCGIYLAITNHLWTPNGVAGNYTVATDGTNWTSLFQDYCLTMADLVQQGLSTAAATQITDCEDEKNGFFTYDRQVFKPNMAAIQAAIFSITVPYTNVVVVPTSQTTAQTWQWTTNTPPSNWYASNFNASAWSTGLAPFGQGYTQHTTWNTTGYIYLRRTFNPGNLTAQQISQLTFSVIHDEDVAIYINGVLAGQASGFNGNYINLAMTPAAQATIVPNATNVLAVSCYQTTGGQVIDVGINLRKSATMPAPSVPAPPTGVGTLYGSSGVGLNWNFVTNATSYIVMRSLTSGSGYTTIGNVPENVFTDTNIISGVTYYYVVEAVNSAGQSTNSSEVNITLNNNFVTSFDGASAAAANYPGAFWGNPGTWAGTAGAGGSPGIEFANNSTPYGKTPYDLTQTNSYISAFVNFANLGGNPNFMLGFSAPAGTSGNTCFLLYLVGNNNLGYRIGGYSESGTLTTGLNLVTNEWYRFTFKLNPVNNSTGGATYSMFVDDWGANGTAFVTNLYSTTNSMATSGLANVATNAYPLIYFGGANTPTYAATMDNFMLLQGPLNAPAPTIVPGSNSLSVAWANVPGADSYVLQRSTTSGGPYTAIATNSTTPFTTNATTTFIDTGLTPGMTYYYVVTTRQNWVGDSSSSFEVAGIPLAGLPPSAPTGLLATGGTNQVALVWNLVPGATNYNVLRSTTSGNETILAMTTSTNFMDTNVVGGTTYYYLVQAVNTNGTSGNSVEVNAMAIPSGLPMAPAGLVATGGANQVALTWNAVVTATNYNVLRSRSSGSETLLVTTASTNFTDTWLANGTTYYYQVSAVNAIGQGMNSSEVSATTIPPVPLGLAAISGTNQVALSWTAAAGVTSYKVLRSTTSGGEMLFATMVSTNYTDTNAVGGTTYYYEVLAANAAGQSTSSVEIAVTPLQGALIPAAAIYGFESNVLDSSGNGNNGAVNGVLAYTTGKVGTYAAQFNGANSWVSIPISIGTTNFTIAMWVNTTDAAGSSGDQWYSDHGLVDGEIPGFVNDFGTALGGGYFKLGIGNPDTTLTSTIKVNDGTWHHVAATWNSGSGAMQLYVDGILNNSGTGPTGSRNAVVNGLHIGNSHDGGNYYNGTLDDVELYNRVLAPTEIAALAGLPVPPTGLTATPGTNQVVLQWNGQPGATNYIVERALDSGGTYTVIGSTGTATHFTDTVVSYGMTYWYAVAAVVAGTQTSYSAPVSAIPLNQYVLATGMPFAKGADVSSESQMETSGYTWLNRNGVQQDIYQVLTNYGVNAVRFKVWVTNLVTNPQGWNCQSDVVAKAVRAKANGLRIMIDFHYSDTWADPGTQDIPAAWTNNSTAQLVTAVSNHTYNVLSALKSVGVTPEWVQVGNEITCGMLWTNGDRCSYNYLSTLAAMINSGYAAVKAVNPSTRVVIHLNNGQQNYQWWFDPMVNLGMQFDAIGLSVYPATTTNWIADTTAALANMNYCAARYGKEVDVSETGLAENAPQQCQSMLVDLMNKTMSVPNNKGLGIFYWEPLSVYWGNGCYGFSGTVGTPTIAMDAFLYSPNQPPASPVLSGQAVAGQMQLSWTAPVAASAFNLKRATVSGGPYSTIASLASTNYTDTAMANGTRYFYVVSAVNGFGEGANSSEVVGIVPTTTNTNIAALYAFEGNVYDTSGNGNDGTAYGALTYTTGKVGSSAVQFNGVDSWVQIPASIGSTNFTIAMWIKTSDSSGLVGDQWYSDHGLVDGEVTGIVNDFGTALGGGKFKLGIGNPDTTLTSSKSINDGNWHHLAGIWNSVSGLMQVFVDGALDSGKNGPTGSRNAVTNNLNIGNGHNGGRYFNGTLDDVELYNRILAPAEIGALAGTAVPAPPTILSAMGGNGQVSLSWTAPIGATNYNVKRSTSSGAETFIASSAMTNYTDTGLASGTTYYYKISAVNAAGEGVNSSEVSAVTFTPLQIRTELTMNGSQLTITWPGWASNYSAYAATNLVSPNWQPVTNVPQSSNGMYYLNLPTTNGPQQFIRLSNP